MSHCPWCRVGRRAAVVDALRKDPYADTTELAKRYKVGVLYVRKVRATAREFGCLPRVGRAKPKAVAQTDGGRLALASYRLPPIGAIYVLEAA